MINFRTDSHSGVPPYLQLVHQVRHALRMGILEPGDQLPTIKEVVGSIAINPNTVAKAYRQLEHEALAEGRPGLGTFVVRRPSGPPPGEHTKLARNLGRWIQSAHAAGLDDESIEAIFQTELRETYGEDTA